MPLFERGSLETLKYAELVKLAKKHDAYRRYATKAELIDKLLALYETPVETLNDVSMPSFMDSDGLESDQDAENVLPPAVKSQNEMHQGSVAKLRVLNKPSSSPRTPLMDKGCINSSVEHVAVSANSRRSTPQSARRSLAGPANRKRLNQRRATELRSSQDSRKLRREATFEVQDNKTDKLPPKTRSGKLKREGTFDVIDITADLNDVSHKSITRKLRREGTFEIESPETDKKIKPSSPQTKSLKRDRTFELDRSSRRRNSTVIETARNEGQSLTSKVIHRGASHLQQPERTSVRSLSVLKRSSIASPSSMKQIGSPKNKLLIPQRLINSSAKLTESASPGTRTSSSKSKIPSLIQEIQRKKDEVSARKLADATANKPKLVKKAPDFTAIHNRLFGKMESLVDSRQKVIDKANSMQKNQGLKRSPRNNKVVRKLLSPKIGKSKFASPKPVLLQGHSVFASNVVSIQKRPSIGSVIQGVSRLQSPQVGPQFHSIALAVPKKLGPTKAAEPSRRDIYKAAVMGRKPIKRDSPMSKAKQCLQSVRLNKRFELQMKHRLAQQSK